MRWYFLFFLYLLNSIQNSFSAYAPVEFGEDDPVYILKTNASAFDQLAGKTYSQLVFFYNNSIESDKYAPYFKKLAAEQLPAQDLVRFGFLNCTEPTNIQICYTRPWGTPMPLVVYYDPYLNPEGTRKGEIVDMPYTKADVSHILREKRGYLFPIFNINSFKTSNEYEFSIFEDGWPFLGPQVQVDLYQNTRVNVRRGYANSSAAVKLGINKLPYATIVGYSQRTQVPYDIARNTVDVEAVERKIREYIYDDRNKPVSYTDLEMAVRTSLQREVTNNFLAMEETKALLKYLNALILYFPARANLRPFLIDLRNSLEKKPEWNSTEVYNLIMNLENKHNPVFVARANQEYQTCSGDEKGYPCALWLLFHTLLGNACSRLPEKSGLEILEAMSGYTYYFQEDRRRALLFRKATDFYNMTSVRNNKEARLWLWWVHNQISKKVNNAPFGKPNYPTYEKCPMCYHSLSYPGEGSRDKINYNTLNPCRICNAYVDAKPSTNWIIGDVYDYLQKQYGEGRIK